MFALRGITAGSKPCRYVAIKTNENNGPMMRRVMNGIVKRVIFRVGSGSGYLPSLWE